MEPEKIEPVRRGILKTASGTNEDGNSAPRTSPVDLAGARSTIFFAATTDREVLQDASKVTAEIAKPHAE